MNLSSDNMRGAILMTVCMAAFSFNDALIKLVSNDYSVFQAIFMRGIIATLLLCLITARQKQLFVRIATADKRLLLIRIIGEIGGTFCFLTALFNMPIANASAILQALPLSITLMAALFLGEDVGWRRYLAILIGFIGVMIIIQPGSEGFNVYSYFAIGAVVFVTIRDLATRRFSKDVSALQVSCLTSLVITFAAGIIVLTQPWRPVETTGLLSLSLAAVFLIFAYLTSVMAMRVGEIGFVSPFRYTILIWAILMGILLFDEVPNVWMLIGTAIVIATGIFTFYREQDALKQVSANSPPD